MSHSTAPSRRSSQRGSALLIVLVFAAIIAIMLYREMPVATFEAQRQKEQLLIDRGNEYKRAVKLYVRKFQTFPPSIEALENTNRMRFLRNRYVDPFTGKDDWRLLHAGPGGVIIDSKVKQNTPGIPGSSPLGAPAAVSNPFANSFDGSNATSTAQPGAGNFPQRPPIVSANGGGGSTGGDPLGAMPQEGQPADAQVPPTAAQNQDVQGQNGIDPSNPMATGSGPFPVGGPGRFRGGPTGNSYPPPGQLGDGTSSTAAPQDPQNTMQSLLNNQNSPPTVQNTPPASAGGSFGQNASASNTGTQMGAMGGNTMGGAGIAGVASNSPGRTIKVVNDQSDRSLWEFVFDIQKEALANLPGGAPGTTQNGTGSPGSPTNPAGSGQSSTFPAPSPPSQSSNQ